MSKFGNRQNVLYIATINGKKVKFGITTRILTERVYEHLTNFDDFQLVAVFTNFMQITHIEQMLKDWCKLENALCTAVNNQGHHETEIIDISVVSLQDIITTLAKWASQESLQNTPLAVGANNVADYFDHNGSGYVPLDDYHKTLKSLGVKKEIQISADQVLRTTLCKTCLNVAGAACKNTVDNVTFIKGAWKIENCTKKQCVEELKKDTMIDLEPPIACVSTCDYFDYSAENYTNFSIFKDQCKQLGVVPKFKYEELLQTMDACRRCKQPCTDFCDPIDTGMPFLWIKGSFIFDATSKARCENQSIFDIYKNDRLQGKKGHNVLCTDVYNDFRLWLEKNEYVFNGKLSDKFLGEKFSKLKGLNKNKVKNCRFFLNVSFT